MPYFLIFLLFIAGANSLRPEPILRICSGDQYSFLSAYQIFLRILLANLTDTAPKSPFFYSSLSAFKIFGFAQCRPDLNQLECTNCLRDSSSRITTKNGCGQSNSAAFYQDSCLLRYSDKNFSFSLDMNATGIAASLTNSANPSDFTWRVLGIMWRIVHAAANATEKFAVGADERGDAQIDSIYAMAWCTRDLTDSDCLLCLLWIIPSLSFEKIGGRVYGFNCLLRFEVYLFVNPTLINPLLNLAFPIDDGKIDAGDIRFGGVGSGEGAGEQESGKINRLLIAVISEGAALVLFFSIFLVSFIRKNKFYILPIKHDMSGEEMRRENSPQLDFGVISAATSHFSEANKLGEGGFGPVYKGILKDGKEIAVKKLSTRSAQGVAELNNEVAFVAKLQHRNLVRLLGWCLEKEKLLVYEFVHNTSLDKHLFDPRRKNQLDWGIRFKIIEGIAQGLLYLHEYSRLRVIHCDLKASNILLDGDMNPKISDFGLAKLFGIDEAQRNTHRIAGTFGYMAPEYALRGLFSTKSDVYSYGVLILEIVTGQRIICNDEPADDSADLLRHVCDYWRKEQVLQVVDKTLGDRYEPKQALRFLQIGLLCIQEDPAQRPSMASLVVMLNSYNVKLTEPVIPAFLR